jgi:hypothetical protein
MTDTEKLEYLIKGLKRIAEQKHCYDENPEYNPVKELNDDVFEDGADYGEIYLSRTLLESIGVEFNYPCMEEKEEIEE